MRLFTIGIGLMGLGLLVGDARAQKPPLLPEKDVAALAKELSGETAKRNLEGIARFHRQRGSEGFHSAAELVAERLRAYGLSDVAILNFAADGKIFYGTQRSRPAWDAELGELSEIDPAGPRGCDEQRVENGKPELRADCSARNVRLIGSYEAQPVVLAEDSETADVTAELVDVGEGMKEQDYAGKAVTGRMVLVGAQPGAVQDLAVGKFGAAGIISYTQNQKTAWSGEDENLIRWGHLETFSANKTFAFMVSLKMARAFRGRLERSEKIWLHAVVKAGQHPGMYQVVTATIPGADPKLQAEEIAFSCHLDHQRPGANDNASGCAGILEVARTLEKLIATKAMERPRRTIRFIFPPEVEGTMALLNGNGRYADWNSFVSGSNVSIKVSDRFLAGPELAKRIKAVVHMDMVGGGPATKAVFHVTRGPMSLPSFVHDVAWSFAEWVNEESYKFAATGSAKYPLIAPEGGKEPLRAEYSAYTMGSDHDVYQDSSFGIPAIYLNDWPDRYIHTNFDTAANIDTTKLKRAAFIGAASGYYLAVLPPGDPMAEIATGQILRSRELQRRTRQVTEKEAANLKRVFGRDETDIMSTLPHSSGSRSREGEWRLPVLNDGGQKEKAASGDGLLSFRRKSAPQGPLEVFGYDYFSDHATVAGLATPKLLSYEGLWGAGEEYAYEVLNFADGQRNAQAIRDAVSAEYGPVPLELVVEYLQALGKIGIVEQVQ